MNLRCFDVEAKYGWNNFFLTKASQQVVKLLVVHFSTAAAAADLEVERIKVSAESAENERTANDDDDDDDDDEVEEREKQRPCWPCTDPRTQLNQRRSEREKKSVKC